MNTDFMKKPLHLVLSSPLFGDGTLESVGYVVLLRPEGNMHAHADMITSPPRHHRILQQCMDRSSACNCGPRLERIRHCNRTFAESIIDELFGASIDIWVLPHSATEDNRLQKSVSVTYGCLRDLRQ